MLPTTPRIRSYADLAGIARAKGIDELASLASVDASRIKRDRWVQGAKSAHRRKYKQRI